MSEQGHAIRTIARVLKLSRRTVRKYLAPSPSLTGYLPRFFRIEGMRRILNLGAAFLLYLIGLHFVFLRLEINDVLNQGHS